MRNNVENIDRRAYLKTAGLATAGMAGLAGCTGGDSTGDGESGDGETTYGTLSTSVTDQPSAIGDFESLTVTIDGVWIKPAGGDGSEESESMDDEEMDSGNESMDGGNESMEMDDEEMDSGNESMDGGNESMEMDDEEMDGGNESMGDGNESESMDDEEMDEEMDGESDDEGRRYIGFDEPQEADLVQLQGNNTQLIDETEVEAREYQFLQLDVSNTEGVLTDGSDATVETPGNAPLKFNTSFEVRANETTRFIADFAPNRRGNGSYIIRPVATSTQVLYGDEEYTAGGDSTNETEMDGEGGSGSDTNSTDTAANGSDTETNSNAGNGNRGGNGNN